MKTNLFKSILLIAILVLSNVPLAASVNDLKVNGIIGNYSGNDASTITTYIVNGVSFNMVDVEGGTFTMGRTADQDTDTKLDGDDLPTHQVSLSSFCIGQTEVTQELWQAVMGSNPSYHTGNLQYPVERVSWTMCQEFINNLNQLTGKKFRLPTEAEWEFAARGGNNSRGYKYAGSNNADDVAWHRYNSGHESHPVGMKLPNELGIYDMTGNVWERLADWYGPYSSEQQFNPTGPETGLKRCTRGSGFGITYDMEGDPYGPHPVCGRGADYESDQHHDMGLRLALGTEPAITTYTVNGVSFNMVDVEGGTFTMGRTADQDTDTKLDGDDLPTHQVSLSSFCIGQTEVTQELWQAVMGSNPSYHTGNLQYPVERVSWTMCQEFINNLNQLTGKKFRLPTEAEWEFAARGGNNSRGYKYAGSNNADDVAWHRYNSGHESHPVGMKLPNELGIYDMTGNVWERLADWYGPYSSEQQFNPTGPETGLKRCTRGSGFGITYDMEGDPYGPHPVCGRGADYVSDQHHDMGLRLVLETEKAGDENGDGEVDVRDITALIDVIMNSITNNPRADVNQDGDIDVRDITALIDIIMNS